jgi:hypothetical protein
MTIVFCKKDLLFCASGDAFAFFPQSFHVFERMAKKMPNRKP